MTFRAELRELDLYMPCQKRIKRKKRKVNENHTAGVFTDSRKSLKEGNAEKARSSVQFQERKLNEMSREALSTT